MFLLSISNLPSSSSRQSLQNKTPTFSSFQPPGINYDRAPDAMMDIPPNVVGLVIGKSGARINDLQARTQAAVREREREKSRPGP